ncbi:hypothetical protein H5410_057231 [Solanum commersonii]|uniref:Reverse transcriptase n=1 Tax=Solanum commersonii TaxID=4109 RepID=A0A9J5WMF1_SOLCO|nr:hypothetical protein H5410_057231 [Solanum commersonii]
MDELMRSIQDEVWRQTLESKGFMLSKTKIEYLKRKFSDSMQEAGVEVRPDTQAIPKRHSFKYLGSISMKRLASRALCDKKFHRNLKVSFIKWCLDRLCCMWQSVGQSRIPMFRRHVMEIGMLSGSGLSGAQDEGSKIEMV